MIAKPNVSPLAPVRSARRPARSGVSILEVMISIGVATVGLLGVVLLLPVALHQIRQGTLQDRAARVGQNAVRDLRSRGLLQPQMLVGWNGNAWANYTTTPYEGFCLDPRFIAEHGANAAAINDAVTFPYTTPPAVFPMRRVTLRSMLPGMPTAVMGANQANRIFYGRDDLTVEAPTEDRTYPAIQISESGNPWDPSQAGERRRADERLTWFATFSPQTGAPNPVPGNNTSVLSTDPKFFSNLYTMSIVVVHNRESSFDMSQSTAGPPPEPANERSVVVSQWHGAGYGGGDVQLMTYNTTPDAAADLLDIRRGSWVMLSPNQALVFHPVTGMPNVPVTYRWYRVAAADDEPLQNANGNWVLNVTLEGADWLFPSLLTENTNPLQCGTRVTVVKNVVAVYEKTIRLQNHSLWTVQ